MLGDVIAVVWALGLACLVVGAAMALYSATRSLARIADAMERSAPVRLKSDDDR